MNNVINDLSTLTDIAESDLNRVVKIIMDCICHSVLDNINDKESTTIVDIGIGTLSLLLSQDCIKYKFIPSTTFENKLKTTIKTKKGPITKEVEDILIKRITNTYKDLL